MSGEPEGHRMVPRGLGDSRKGDKEAWGAHREGKGPSGWDLCSPFLCALGVPTEIPAGPFWGFLVVFPLLKQGFFAVRMLGAGRGSGAELGSMNLGASVCLESHGPGLGV